MLMGLGLWFILAVALSPAAWSGEWWLLLFGSFLVGVTLTDLIGDKQ